LGLDSESERISPLVPYKNNCYTTLLHNGFGDHALIKAFLLR